MYRNLRNLLGLLLMSASLVLGYDIFNDVYYPGKKGTLLEEEDFSHLPKIFKRYRRIERRTKFTGHHNASSFYTSRESGKEQFNDVLSHLSWETTSVRTGRRVATYVNVASNRVGNTPYNQKIIYYRKLTETKQRKRTRRNIYGQDDRAYIPINKHFGLKEPYSYTVKLSVGCTGIIISPRHVLTAAHCIHSQKDYLTDTKKLKAGFLQADNKIEWISIKSMKVSKGWTNGEVENGPFYDYALLKLVRKHGRPFIRLGISESEHHGAGERISFTGFDEDKPANTMWYRSCSVMEDDPSFLYHYCDAKPGSSGSGVYSWVYDENEKEWKRALVGVFSGNRWRKYDEFYVIQRNFNVAVRLTSNRYAQICKWLGKTADQVCHAKK